MCWICWGYLGSLRQLPIAALVLFFSDQSQASLTLPAFFLPLLPVQHKECSKCLESRLRPSHTKAAFLLLDMFLSPAHGWVIPSASCVVSSSEKQQKHPADALCLMFHYWSEPIHYPHAKWKCFEVAEYFGHFAATSGIELVNSLIYHCGSRTWAKTGVASIDQSKETCKLL